MISYGGLGRMKEKEVVAYFESTNMAHAWMEYRKHRNTKQTPHKHIVGHIEALRLEVNFPATLRRLQ
jgi:hypothetical protein